MLKPKTGRNSDRHLLDYFGNSFHCHPNIQNGMFGFDKTKVDAGFRFINLIIF